MLADWTDFRSIYHGKNLNKVFEALVRLLFRVRYGLPDSLPYFCNHAGNETETIEHDGETIGFQSKYFDDGKIDASQFEKSLIRAREWNKDQTVQLLYTNSEFGNPRKGYTQTSGQINIQNKADELGMKIEWLYGDNVLDLASKNKLAYDLFFNPDLNMRCIDEDIRKSNDIRIKHVNNNIVYKGIPYVVDRKSETEKMASILHNGKSVIIVGEGGCGKSALGKDYYNANKENTAIFIINGEQLCTDDVNHIFHVVNNDYTLSSFRRFYEGNERKVIIIDSAERMCFATNKEPLSFMFEELMKVGWQFLFTVRSNAEEELKNILMLYADLECETIKIENLSISAIQKFSEEVNIELPKETKLLSKLTIPFYLARYTDVYDERNTLQSIKAFKESLWEKKIKGNTDLNAVLREKRESCFLELVNRQNVGNSYIIKTNDIDKEALLSLVQDEIIAKYGMQRYYITHDIYADFATEYSIFEDYEQSESFESFVNSIGDNSKIITAFGRILSEMIDNDDSKVGEIIKTMMNGALSQQWEQMVLTAVLRSDDYAPKFFNAYCSQFDDDHKKWFKSILKNLKVSCLNIISYIHLKGNTHPMMSPVGSGWSAAIDYMYEHDYRGDYTYDILNAFYRYKGVDASVMKKAALLAFRPIREVADKKKKNEEIYYKDDNNVYSLICCYASYLKEELTTMVDEVVANNWVTHRCPYYGFCNYIATNNDAGGQMAIAKAIPLPYMKLLNSLWKEPSDKSEYYDDNSFDKRLKVFGLNKAIHYFYSSAYQTPVYCLLMNDADNTIDFVISFINDRVSYYKNHCKGYDFCIYTSNHFHDGEVNHYISSYNLWSMYRGVVSASMPDLLESIHMALEKYLLELAAKDENKEVVSKYLLHILRNSKSVSLVAVVASIVMANPKKYLEVGLLVMDDLHFFLYDQNRSINEIQANMFAGMGINETLMKERFASNKLEHRKTYIERILFAYQIANAGVDNDEQKNIQHRIYSVVDELKKQLSGLSSEERETAEFIIGRLDYRAMPQEERIINGKKFFEIHPAFSDRLKKISEEVQDQSKVNSMPLSLSMWATEYAKGNKDKLLSSPYMNNIQKVMDDLRASIKSISDVDPLLKLMPDSVFLPAIVGATVVTFFSNEVSEEDFVYCKQSLIRKLRNINGMITSLSSELEHCLKGLVSLIKLETEKIELETYADVMLLYMDNRMIIPSYRASDSLHNVIVETGLWKEKPEFMKLLLSRYEEKILIGNYDNLDIDKADSMLSVLPIGTNDNSSMFIVKRCLQELSKLWVRRDKYHLVGDYTVRRLCSYHIAAYILSLPVENVREYVAPFTSIITFDRDCESFVRSFIMYCINLNKYELFWIVWDELYSSIFNDETHWYDSSTINAYLLNPDYLNSEAGDDWFKLRKENIHFYESVANDVGDKIPVFISILKVASTIGKRYHREFVHIVNKIVTKHPKMKFYNGEEKNVVFYMEKFMQQVDLEISSVKLDAKYLSEVKNILLFSKDRGSSVAHSLLLNC